MMKLANDITGDVFFARFPRSYIVRALNPFLAQERHLAPEIMWWSFDEPFTFVSDVWGVITQEAGAITDFASVPLRLQSVYQTDSPIMLFPSAPHDLLFQKRADKGGTRGWLDDATQLTLEQCNAVFTEAMFYCGASSHDRAIVHAGLTLGNRSIRHQFADRPAPPRRKMSATALPYVSTVNIRPGEMRALLVRHGLGEMNTELRHGGSAPLPPAAGSPSC